MTDILGFSPVTGALIVIAYFTAVLFPIMVALFFVIRNRALLRKWLFIVSSTALTYGFFLFLFLAIQFPLSAWTNFVAPQLEYHHYYYGRPFVHTSRFLDAYGFIIYPIAFVAMSLFLGYFLASRWNRIVEALKG
jgi:hypothetical protein